jgi:hypothetical protein
VNDTAQKQVSFFNIPSGLELHHESSDRGAFRGEQSRDWKVIHVERGNSMRTILAGGLAFISLAPGADAQFSGYASGSYGFHTDPLYNYATVSDQAAEGYWEMSYLLPSRTHDFRAGYVGGLMIFNTLSDRNYYEHRLNAGYTARYGKFRKIKQQDDDEEDTGGGDLFRGNTVEIGGTLSARYDNSVYDQYDNKGLDLSGGFTWGVGSGTEFKLSDQGGIRRYRYLPELNNITDILTARLSDVASDSLRLGFFVTAGVKHFTTAQIDTTRVKMGGGTFNQGNKGKGKGGAGLSGSNGGGQNAKTLQILENSGNTNTYQLSAGVSTTWKWNGGNVESQLLYRYNPGSTVRFLVQYANTTILSQDIYNDFFSYGGPELSIGFRQKLPLSLQLTVQSEAEWKRFLAPALNLNAEETSAHRIDLRGATEVTLSRSFPIDDAWSFDISLNAGAIRNQSDDAYNDYSLFYYSVSIGIGL